MLTPQFDTAINSPLKPLKSTILSNQAAIEDWFQAQWKESPAPFYASVDLRNAGFKLAPVDTNLFPAGFNNLEENIYSFCQQAIRNTLASLKKAQTILLIPENHTRNLFYIKSLSVLVKLIENAGFKVILGSLETSEAILLSTNEDTRYLVHPVKRKNDLICIKDIIPDAIILNNDLSDGIPSILEDIAQPCLPPIHLGWSKRLKSIHFEHYQMVVQDFAELINIDPWLIDPIFRYCGEINFKSREGETCIKENVNALIQAIQSKYDQYGINKKPFVLIKADAGTYGMGVTTVYNPDDILSLNRKQRNKMNQTKGSRAVTRVLVQEGVYTSEKIDTAYAEPVIYAFGNTVVGGFYRFHEKRAIDQNLNAPGMLFQPFTLKENQHTPNRFYAYSVIGRLAILAASKEILAYA